jgi:hypothetical protein
MYWGVIDSKIRQFTDSSPRQKGFTPEPGSFINVHTLNEILRLAKTKDGIVIIHLNISKAFDTIPHQAIDPALQRLNFPVGIRSANINSYQNAKTIIQHRGSCAEITIRRGDPLSPFIFNAIMGPLFKQLEALQGYKIDNNRHVSFLAFADDLIILANSEEKAQQMLCHTELYLKKLGMSIPADKCTAFKITTTRDS